jgi:transcriptional regulator with XRE-family HTH domain
MNIGERLKSIREGKNMSQGDVERRTGLLRCYISRVEHGHTVPSVETLEKLSRALDMKIYEVLFDGNEPPPPPVIFPGGKAKLRQEWGSRGKEASYLNKLTRILPVLREDERNLLLFMLARMAAAKKAAAGR